MPDTDLIKIIRNGADVLSIYLSDYQVLKLVNYIKLLIKWNKVYNLTSITDPIQIAIKHVLDSLSIIKCIDIKTFNNILDIGTGGGLPGVVLAIVIAESNPDSNIVLLDSNSKKTAFLKQVKIELDLNNTTVINSRIEDIDNLPELSGKKYSVVISRAFSSLKKYIECINSVQSIINSDSIILAMKAKYSETQKEIDEFEQYNNNDKIYHIAEIIKISVPYLAEERCLVKIVKV